MTTVTASSGISHGTVLVPATPARQSATRLRLTRRGRRLLASLAASPVVLALALAVIAGGSAIASRDGGAPSSFEMVTVVGGDTLWSLAQDVAPSADPRDVVDAIARLNALDGVTITPGQRLAIPAEYSDAD